MYSQGDPLFIEYADKNVELEDNHRNDGASTFDRVSVNINPSQLRQMANV